MRSTSTSAGRVLVAWLSVLVVLQGVAVVATDRRDARGRQIVAAPTTTSFVTAPPATPRPTATSTTEAPPAPTTSLVAPAPSSPPESAPPIPEQTASRSTTPVTRAPVTTTVAAQPPCCGHWTMAPYLGVGAWVDVYDWTMSYAWTKGRPTVSPDQVDDMAAAGVQTLFIQTARTDGPDDVSEPARLRQFIDAAHANGIHVVGWYLPTLTDPERDLRRLVAGANLGIEGFTVDIESKDVADEAERNRRLIEVSRRFRAAVPNGVIGTVVVNAFAIEEIKPEVWPNFPWAEIDPYYDVWQPMAYVSYRDAGTRERDAEYYTAQSIEAMRRHVGAEPIHVVTGTADDLTVDDIRGFVRASVDHAATGGSIYDWSVASPGMWDAMAPLRS